MKVAIIGSGIAGLSAAYYLNKFCDIQLYEAGPRLGGHTATVDIELEQQKYAIDTGFIVYNDWTYPNFIKLLEELQVENQATPMGFSVKCEKQNIEYCGSGLNGFFAQRKNVIKPIMWTLLRDILRFNEQTLKALSLQTISADQTLDDFLSQNHYSEAFKTHYIIPMAAAIWSSGSETIRRFPFLFFANFFKNHGLLSLKDRPQWRVIKGGSKSYIAPLVESFKDKISINCPVLAIQRADDGVYIKTQNHTTKFDQVVIATHSDQALNLLADPSATEKDILTAIPYQQNDIVLHTDIGLLPKNKRTWSSWNFLLNELNYEKPILTYNMNILQGIKSKHTFCVTLNATHTIDPNKIIGRYQYSHPVFSSAAVKAQEQWQTINGQNRSWFCGAYWYNGFHEDGVKSGIRVANAIGALTNEQRNLSGSRAAQAL